MKGSLVYRLLCVAGVSFAAAMWSCGSSTGSEFGNGNDGDGDGGGTSSPGFGAGGDPRDGGGGGGGGGPEVCDGVDNDGNGSIDDVDVGNDGICDCLRVATLGVAGQWGQGDVFSAWLDARSDLGATDLAGQRVTKELLEQFQVIVIQNVSAIGRSYDPAEVAALDAWVRGGGGLLTLIGYGDPSERQNVNTLLASFGMSYGATQILQKQGGATVPVTSWVSHPATTDIARVGVDNGYPVEGAGVTIATEQGHVMLKAQDVGSGRVLVWGDEWITYNTEWTEHPDYQVERFWLNMIKWLTPKEECQVPIPPSIK